MFIVGMIDMVSMKKSKTVHTILTKHFGGENNDKQRCKMQRKRVYVPQRGKQVQP